jgi:hypothetical protein
MWKLNQATDQYDSRRKWYAKKRKKELDAVDDNLAQYFAALNNGGNPLQIKDGAIRSEGGDVYRISQHGAARGNLEETRLYVYPEVETSILHLLTIGDKRTQSEDIQFAKECVKAIKKQRASQNERVSKEQRERSSAQNGQAIQQCGGDGARSGGGQGAGREGGSETGATEHNQ